MTVAREAIVLPMIFLTVAGLGGLRIGHTVLLLPPPLISLVLAIVLVAALIRAGAFAPQSVLNTGRSELENVSGLVIVLTLFAASAQVFTLVTPEHGLLHVVFSVCFFVQLTTTLAGVNGRRNLLRSLVVLLGCAFVVRFVVLEALYTPDRGLAKRLLTTIMEGASLGTIQYEPAGAVTGYIAFFTLGLYVIGVMLLPTARPRGHLTVRTSNIQPATLSIVLIAVAVGCWGCRRSNAEPSHQAGQSTIAPSAGERERGEALAAARVWSQPAIPIPAFDFAANPPGGYTSSDEVSCRFTVQKLTGLTPKFHCQLPDGRILKVKYGDRNAELQAEVAGTRLLRSLGFPADDMFIVRSVHCAGCPRFPFSALECNERLVLSLLCFGGELRYDQVRTFTTVVTEQKADGTAIESFDDQGWSWYELDRVDPTHGGSSRAEVDALRLMAMVLAHWDNKGANQRLLCPPGGDLPGGRCKAPVAMIHDLGATFGPPRVDLPNWRRLPIWSNRATCTISMKMLPYAGATFPDRQISEAGRLLIAGLLEQLSIRQLTDLFTASRIVLYDQIDAEARNAGAWARVFRDKVRQIREGAPCPQ
jgi:hypothetical protein